MKKLFFLLMLCFSLNSMASDDASKVRLIIRADDMGSSHAANLACIDAYLNGIVTTVEVMVNCAWFPEAVYLLKQHPDLDVGVHLVLTSEWDLVKWRPLTQAPSLVDENGYFYPMVWPNDNYPSNQTLSGANWKLKEIERELRAQIELAKKNIPQLSHLSTHMGFDGLDDKISALVKKLGSEYDLDIITSDYNTQYMSGWQRSQSAEERVDQFIENLAALEPGVHLFVEHPAYDVPEMRGVYHTGYEDVARDRYLVTHVLKSNRVKTFIEEQGIELISYKDLKTGQ